MFSHHLQNVLIALLLFIPLHLDAAAFPEPAYQTVLPGVDYGKVVLTEPNIIFHVVKISLPSCNLTIKPITAMPGETLAKLTTRLRDEGVPLVAAINGDYFYRESPNRIPWGVQAQEGELIFSPNEKSAFILDESGRPLIARVEMKAYASFGDDSSRLSISAVNRYPEAGKNESVLFTPGWGDFAPEIQDGLAIVVHGVNEKTVYIGRPFQGVITSFSRMPVRLAIPENGLVLFFPESIKLDPQFLKPGTPVTLEIDILPAVKEAIGGGPRILRSGQVNLEFTAENFSPASAAYLKRGDHPRSAIGYNADRDRIFLVMVEGRSQESQGLDMKGLATLMLSLGVREAMSFDGGDSAGLFVGDRMASPDRWREISNALGVFAVKDQKP